jgi:hypothetical protein
VVVAAESTASAAGSAFLPQATKARAKPHTASIAINFFIVTGFIIFSANIIGLNNSWQQMLFFPKD